MEPKDGHIQHDKIILQTQVVGFHINFADCEVLSHILYDISANIPINAWFIPPFWVAVAYFGHPGTSARTPGIARKPPPKPSNEPPNHYEAPMAYPALSREGAAKFTGSIWMWVPGSYIFHHIPQGEPWATTLSIWYFSTWIWKNQAILIGE